MRIQALKADLHALAWVARHAQTPWYARLWLFIVLAYALSPLDLIPDFIPVLGYIDDLVLVPLGIYLALRLVPPDLLQTCREQAAMYPAPAREWWKIPIVVATWIVAIWLLYVWLT